MGADIHMFVEKRMPSGNWVCVRDLNEVLHSEGMSILFKDREFSKTTFQAFWELRGRNYELFAALAGVRGDGPEPRDIPEDVSEYVEYEYEGWGSDSHSASWYSADEFVQIYNSIGVEVDEEIPLNPYVTTRMEHGAEMATAQFLFNKASVHVPEDGTVDDYRFVFWFDN